MIRPAKRGVASGVAGQPPMVATAWVQPPEARWIFTGRHETVKPDGGSWSRFANFSIWH